MDRDTQPTLTARVARLETILLDRGEPRYVGSTQAAKQQHAEIMSDRAADEKFFAGQVGSEGHREDQRDRNKMIRNAVDQIHPKNDMPVPTAFEEIISRIQGSSDRVCRSASNLEEIGTRVMGQLPETDCGKNCVGVDPDGTLDHCLLALNRLDTSLARLEAAALRLERI